MTDIKQYRSRLRFYFAWDFKKEERWLDECSAKGEHMDRLTLFRYRFHRSPGERFAYRYDFQPFGYRDRRFKEYLIHFTDAGWEYVGSIGLWHCFRRMHDPSQNMELYTDKATMKQFYQRIQRVFGLVLLMNLPILAFNANNLLTYIGLRSFSAILGAVVVLQFLMILLLGYGMIRIQRRIGE